MRRKLVGLAAVGAALVGCGGSSPEDAVRDTLDAFAEGDGEVVCENLVEEGEDKTSALLLLALAIPGASDRISDPPQGSPEERCAFVANRLGPAIPNLEELREADVADVDVMGDTATVNLGGEPFELEERNGDWKLKSWGPLGQSGDASASTSPRPRVRHPHLPASPSHSVEPEPAPLGAAEDTELESVAAELGELCTDSAIGGGAEDHEEQVARLVPQFARAYEASPQSADDRNLLEVAIDNLESGCGTSEQAGRLRELE